MERIFNACSFFCVINYILSTQMIDKELEKNLYIIVSLFLFFLEREFVIDIMFLFISFCF